MPLIAPAATEIIQFNFAARRITNDRILPTGQLHDHPLRFLAKKPGFADTGRPKPEPPAGRFHGGNIADFGFNDDDMRHTQTP
jgi:hypothetical protein